MIEKQAMCICTGMFAHVDGGVLEPVFKSWLLPQLSSCTCQGRAAGASSQRGWKDGARGGGRTGLLLQRGRAPFGPQTTPLWQLLPIVNDVGIENCREDVGVAAVSPEG